ncbi:MAG TPA: STAS domain-containing protein [Solirubrobacteraceae bacterium]|jgi:anti-sigma B factor antagonist|nr:STAS domain-containing protein [Solirubrobacteraceae bacterium]
MIDPADAPRGSTPEYPTLRVRHRDLGDGLCVVVLEGEIDLATAPVLKSAVTELLPKGLSRFIIDLSGVRHMDSTGLGVLVGFRRRLADHSRMAIAGARSNVRAVIELTGLDFQVFGTVEEAVAHLEEVRERQPPLSADSAMVVGLASTALPFADSPVEEAERWLRVLRLHGEAGRAIASLGLSEAPLEDSAAPAVLAQLGTDSPDREDPIAAVVDHAKRAATERASTTVGTADLLRGVMAVYGADFDWVLRARGSDPAEVMERLERSSVVSAR